MKNKRILLIIFSFLLVNMLYINTAAATSKVPISGKITDSDLRPITGAKIVFEMEGGLNGIQVAKTDYRGNYTIYLPLTSKTYWVTIGKDKYRTYRGKIHLKDDSDNFNFTVHK
ncbi:carboxypeptidase-like regulatory domain-containing protein [Pelosinus sp. IPA-1]|uniref:carboxypeptidase-like regulatory domain-containing protein n=1 Tax=Pelosinus sp. IPA-1 TaxID=3029569 RepID=UPI0024362026|nr:carboxypeptidase-like regulatory domain-containing protein [Pelosinus sp. IPA-1]GMA99843.1 hypothetical protein PIPA1_26430 [Pelosinus sp. IPA-1]